MRPGLCLAIAAWLAVGGLLPGASAQTTGGVAATIITLEGQVEVVPAGSQTAVSATVGMRVLPGATVRSKANGRAELQFDDRTLLRLDHNTEVQILAGPQARGVMVTLGNIWAKVQSVLGASKFQVKTPTVVAGVRGTVLRAEVSVEESAIAVDEGEVEVSPQEGQPPVLLRQSQEVRARRGAPALTPKAFSPEARAKWEYWTDPLAEQEVQAIREAAAASQKACEDVHQQAQGVFGALAVDGQAAWRVAQRVKGAHGLVAQVQAALRPGPHRGGRPGKPLTPAQMQYLLDAAETTYAECLPLAERGRKAAEQHTAGLNALRDALVGQQKSSADLADKVTAFRYHREVDPHWQTWKPHCEESELHHQAMRKHLDDCAPILAPEAEGDLGEDPLVLKTIAQRFKWTIGTLDVLRQLIAADQAEIERLRPLIAKPGPRR